MLRLQPALVLAFILPITQPIRAQDFAVVATHLIYPGQVVEATSLEIVDATYCPNCDSGFFREPAPIVGKVAVRSLLPGKLIFPSDLKPAPAVLRGKAVNVIYVRGALNISMSGVALSDAAINEVVAVRNSRSGATITGIVQRDGTVAVNQ